LIMTAEIVAQSRTPVKRELVYIILPAGDKISSFGHPGPIQVGGQAENIVGGYLIKFAERYDILHPVGHPPLLIFRHRRLLAAQQGGYVLLAHVPVCTQLREPVHIIHAVTSTPSKI